MPEVMTTEKWKQWGDGTGRTDQEFHGGRYK